MGFRYSLSLIVQRRLSGTLLENLRFLLDDESKSRLPLHCWLPATECPRVTAIGTEDVDARGIAGFRMDREDRFNDYCLSIHIQLESELQQLVPNHGFDCFDKPGSFGCLWTSAFAGSEYLLFQMTAATSGMSRVLAQSEAIHTAWSWLAQSTRADFAYVDLEERSAIPIHPATSPLLLPNKETLAFQNDTHYSVDRFGRYLRGTVEA